MSRFIFTRRALTPLLAAALSSCAQPEAVPSGKGTPKSQDSSEPSPANHATGAPQVPTAPAQSAAPVPRPEGAPTCPAGMQHVPAGEFWSGSQGQRGPKDEHPRFRTQLHAFCLDQTEVTVQAYTDCETSGTCTSAAKSVRTCNGNRSARAQHPINCTTWEQAQVYCQSQGKRLPTELEWEYAARGGAEQRKFSWGSEQPDGKTCWKRPGTCEVAKHALGAFGLHDMNGNVWEWTDSFYGPYPWPAKTSPTKVYRGGSWSRRFAKWMSLTLRNRYGTTKWGSHLGFRCAKLATDTTCPYGEGEGGRCLHGVEEAECPPHQAWNGIRCTTSGSQDGPDGCASGTHAEPGFGCVVDDGFSPSKKSAGKAPPTKVSVQRSPGFDADCRTHQPKRPRAYRLAGGTHQGRNVVARRRGCKNRDVGVGWNSACCR